MLINLHPHPNNSVCLICKKHFDKLVILNNDLYKKPNMTDLMQVKFVISDE